MNYFIFNGIDSRKYRVYLTGVAVYSSPVRNFTRKQVIGRNGDIYIDNGSFQNVDIIYKCQIKGTGKVNGFIDLFDGFRKALSMTSGYCELTDSYNPGIKREAFLSGAITPTAMGNSWLGGEFQLTFSAKPQRYTTKGQTKQNIGSVIKGAIGGVESSIVGDGVGTLVASNSYCRSAGLNVSNGATIALSTTHTAHNAVNIYVAEYNSTTSVAASACVKAQWVSVPKGEIVQYTLQESTVRIRLCWNANTMTTTDEADQQIVTCITPDRTYRFGTNRVYYYFDGKFETNPIIELYSPTNLSAAKITFNDITIRVGTRTGNSSVIICDCEAETFKDQNGNSLNSVANVYANEEVTRSSPKFPELRPGWNIIKVHWDTWKYDPHYNLYLTTREWEV